MREFGDENLEIVLKLLEKYEIEDIKLLQKSQNLAFIKQNILKKKKYDDIIRIILEDVNRKTG